MRRLKFIHALFLMCVLCLAAQSCSRAIRHPDWSPDVKKGLNDFIRREGNSAEKKYVVFDFDNTTSIFDIAEQLMIYQLETMSFNLTPDSFADMALTGMDEASEGLSDVISGLIDSYRELYSRYGPFSYKGVEGSVQAVMREDPLWKDFAIEMGRIYYTFQEYLTADESYMWILGWFAGMTGPEVYDMASRSHKLYGSRETTVSSWLSGSKTHSWIDGISVTDNIRELWKALDDNGFDIWVCSASEVATVMAAVDAFGLHEYCDGVLAMTMAEDSAGRYLPVYDFTEGCGFRALEDGSWVQDTIPTRAKTMGPGKVEAISRCLVPRYGGQGPSACFMDATGDFNFCTEFSSTRLCVCFNRATRKVTDGGGLIAEVAVYEKEALNYNLRKANRKGDILYLLQGRDENGLRKFRPSSSTVRLGEEEPKLFASDENYACLEYFKENGLSVKDILETFCIRTDASDTSNPLGFTYGFLDSYEGYRSRE